MTAQELHDYFELLSDQYGSNYFSPTKKDLFLSLAAIEYVKQQLPSAENPGVNLELDQLNFNNVDTLVFTTGSTNMNSSGIVTRTAVQTLLNTASSSTEPFMGILDVNWTKTSVTYPVRYTKHNNWFSYMRNEFKRGTATSPRYKYDKTNFTFYPVDTGASLVFTLLKQPRPVILGSSQTFDLPEHTHKAVVELAANLAYTSQRESEAFQINNAK